MRKEDFEFNIQVEKTMEFKFNNLSYTIRFDKNSDGNQIIYFGRTFEEKKYTSYGEFMNNARVENHFFKDLLEDLDL